MSIPQISSKVKQQDLFPLYCFQVSMKRITIDYRWCKKFLFTTMLWFVSGCYGVSSGFSEQLGLRLESAQLHRCRSRGKHTPVKIQPDSLLRWIPEKLMLGGPLLCCNTLPWLYEVKLHVSWLHGRKNGNTNWTNHNKSHKKDNTKTFKIRNPVLFNCGCGFC